MMDSNATSTHITDNETSASGIPSQGPSSLSTGEKSNVAAVVASKSTFSAPAPQSNKETLKERFTKQDIENSLTFLEHPSNFESVFGSGGPTTTGKPNQSSNQGYAILAQIVSRRSKGRLNLNAKAMREQFACHRKTFITVKNKLQQAGFGVTDEDWQKGIYTISHKLESMCTCYDRMDALFSSRRNASPLARLPTSVPVAQDSVLEDDDRSVLSISSTQVLQRQQKRPLMDTETQTSNKRTCTTDRHKTQPTLDSPSSSEVSRRSFLSSFDQATTKTAYVTEVIETKRLELEENRLEWEMSLKLQKLELEEQRESLRLELKEQRESLILELEEQRESIRLELEVQKMEQESQRWKTEMESRVAIQTLLVIQAGWERGVSEQQIRALINTIVPRSN
ncbi:MAG: hypothetical protein J3R72DRAFT_22897 [Linnemannia gamsii]|nr:MAG: hypothetical protein J3R72DRAFT_22897 [Linnemannia gamsii]